MVFLFLGQAYHHFLETWPSAFWVIHALCSLSLLALQRRGLRPLLLLSVGYAWAQFAAAPTQRCDPWLWFLCEAQPGKEKIIRYLNGGYLGQAAAILRSFVEDRCLAWDKRWGPWLLGMLAGVKASDGVEELYRQLGLLHVLVVSGSHFSVLTLILSRIFIAPWRGLYSLHLFSMNQWVALRMILESALILAALVFLLMVGAQAPCQRAFLLLFVSFCQRWTSARSDDLYLKAFCLQATLFPSSFFSLSNLLSWGATACILIKTSKHDIVKAEILIQTMSFAFFGSLSPLGGLINLLLAPIWDAVIFLALLLILWGDRRFGDVLRAATEHFHSALSLVAAWQEHIWTAPNLVAVPPFNHILRFCALLPCAFVLLRILNKRREF